MFSANANSPERMQCMEVWGGNSPVARSFRTPGLKLWLHSRPYKGAESGGDVYYVSSCASGRITRFLLADVSGHGQKVAQMAAGLRDLMRQNINLIKQTRFVSEMNRQFVAHPQDGGFATALVCTYFAPSRTLQFCNAGHPMPLIYVARTSQWSLASERATVQRGSEFADAPLGVIEGGDYSLFSIQLSYGDMMLCVSDAYTEAVDSEGEQLGQNGLLRIVEQIDPSEPAEIIPKLIGRLTRTSSDNLASDDATALLFQCDGSKTTVQDNLLAPFRLLRPVRDKTVIHA
ncbi:MAG: serine/threonine-protein phosphatase [Planctomycetes bacterium]|nr:serine/threonine-protein phosphatase [Planctomycetota bacterium]